MPNVKCILAEQGGKGGGSGTGIVLKSIEVTTPPTKISYLAGDTFNTAGMVVTASYGLANSVAILTTAEVTGSCTITPSPLVDGTTMVTISYSENGTTVSTTQNITVIHKLQSIAVTTNPTKVTYEYGDTLATAGLVVTATYSDGATAAVTSSCSPTALNTVGTQTITASYSENGVTKTATFQVTVNRKTITVPTWKGTLTYNGSQQSANNATLWNNFTTNMTIGGTTTGTNAGSYNAAFTPGSNYRWPDGTTEAKTVAWSIGVLSVATPTANTTSFTYNGNTQGPTFTYNSTYVTPSGDTAVKTNAGSYTATFTLKSTTNTKWSDNTTDAKTISWSIAKASGSFGLSATTASINASNYSTGVTVTVSNPTGTVTVSSSNSTACPVSISGNTITIKGNGSTAGTYTVTVKCAASTNYNAPADKTITVTAEYWSWGADGGTADAAWFTGLKNYLASNTGASLKTSSGGNILGTTKSVTLTSAVLGTTTHLIRVIGVDQDADKTVTFQTANTLATTTLWSTTAYSDTNTTAARWTDSACKAKAECTNYYNAFPGKSAIKTVKKGTCASTNDSRNGTPTYNDETVFLLSERELGLDSRSPLSTANSTTSKAECTQGKNFSYAYYTDNNTRIKKQGDSGSAYAYWERSRYGNSSSSYPTFVCRVSSSGGASRSTYNGSFGLAPAFVIGN